MDKTIAGLLGAMGALAAAGPSQAATPPPSIQEVMHAAAYADLLKPIPNAAALLPASDALLAEAPADVTLVQYHDHHHHRTHRRPPPRRRHHHHHHDSMMLLRGAPTPV